MGIPNPSTAVSWNDFGKRLGESEPYLSGEHQFGSLALYHVRGTLQYRRENADQSVTVLHSFKFISQERVGDWFCEPSS